MGVTVFHIAFSTLTLTFAAARAGIGVPVALLLPASFGLSVLVTAALARGMRSASARS